jgi:hypothetical protein
LLESAQIIGRGRIFFGQYIDIADFNVGWLPAWPFGACIQKSVALSDHTRRTKCVTWNKKLHVLTAAQIRTDNDALSCPIGAQHQDFKLYPRGNNDKADRCGCGADALVRPALP